MADYYTILTNVGKAKVTNAQVLGNKLNITNIAIGDGSGKPNENQTQLRNEVWRGRISMVSIDDNNPNWIVIEGIIPADVGGFTVREVGIFDDNNNLVAVGNYPETYKPILEQGSSKDLFLRMIIEVSNASVIELKIDPTVAIPSQSWVSNEIEKVAQTLIPKTLMGEPDGVATLDEDGLLREEQMPDSASAHASNVKISDSGKNYTSNNVEGALQEVAVSIGKTNHDLLDLTFQLKISELVNDDRMKTVFIDEASDLIIKKGAFNLAEGKVYI